MNTRTILVVSALIIFAVLLPTACQPARPPAVFDVSPLRFKPAQATVGTIVTVSADVSNNGGTEGAYTVTMSIDGQSVQSKDLDLAPGTSRTVDFTFQRDQAGTYEIAIGGSSKSYVIGPKLVAKEMELKNDNGIATDYLAVVKPFTGYIESFDPGAVLITVSEVSIAGLIYGGHGFQIGNIELQILGGDRQVLFKQTYPANQFPVITFLTSNLGAKGNWVDLDVPDVDVQGPFFVNIYTGNTEMQGFRMGASDSLGNTHSDLTIRDAQGHDNTSNSWPYSISNWFGDKSRVNWLIHVKGIGMVPAPN